MGSSHAQPGHVGINTLDTGTPTRFPRSRLWPQGQRSQDQNSVLMHIYPTWVVYKHKLATLASIPWAQDHLQDSQGQGCWPQRQRSQDQNSMPMHNYTSWVVHTPSLGKLIWIPWPQWCPQKIVDGQTDKQTDRWTDGQTDYYRAPAFSCGALNSLLAIFLYVYMQSSDDQIQEAWSKLTWHTEMHCSFIYSDDVQQNLF